MTECRRAKRDDQGIIKCQPSGDLCGHVKYCRAERKWKLSPSAVNCTKGREKP